MVAAPASAPCLGPGTPVLRVRHLTKTFGPVRALDDVSLEVLPGEVHALVGHNGSGKSTVVKVLAGYHAADPGAELWWEGEPVDVRHMSRIRAGMGFVHQDLGLISSMSAAENFAIGRGYATSRTGQISWSGVRAEAQAAVRRLGGQFEVGTPVGRLEAGERTVVAIARALGVPGETRLLVLDEPTASLPAPEVERLLDAVRKVAAQNAGVVYVSHRLDEVLALADRVSVLRDGRLAGTYRSGEFDVATLTEMITGHAPAARGPQTAAASSSRSARLSVRGLRSGRLEDLSVDVAGGEVVGITGILGSGREDVAGAVFGSRPRDSGSVSVDGRVVPSGAPAASIAARLALVPADRAQTGLVMGFSLRENVSLPVLSSLTTLLGISRRRERSRVGTLLTEVAVRPHDLERRVDALSGGNQQKVLLAKWMATEPAVLVLEEPGQGIDIGAKAAIYDRLRRLATEGLAILVVTAETEDLPGLCDRVLVLRHGRVAAELTGDALTDHRIVHESLAP